MSSCFKEKWISFAGGLEAQTKKGVKGVLENPRNAHVHQAGEV